MPGSLRGRREDPLGYARASSTPFLIRCRFAFALALTGDGRRTASGGSGEPLFAGLCSSEGGLGRGVLDLVGDAELGLCLEGREAFLGVPNQSRE